MGQMNVDDGKTFDLTFKGTILPKQNSERVRMAIAELFSIEDPGLLRELFDLPELGE